jgi:hypothetical protein
MTDSIARQIIYAYNNYDCIEFRLKGVNQLAKVRHNSAILLVFHLHRAITNKHLGYTWYVNGREVTE